MSNLKVILVIPDHNTGRRLADYLGAKYGVSVTLLPDIQGIKTYSADAFIIYRQSIEVMEALEGIEGTIGLLYGNMPIPVTDTTLTYRKLIGTLPGCVHEFMESIVGWQGDRYLTWGETPDLEFSSSLTPTQKPIRSVALFSPGGGVGKTTTVVHLAKLAEQARINVGIIETDEDKGGVLRYLGKQPAQVGLDTLEEVDWGNEGLFRQRIGEVVQTVGRIKVVPMVGTLNGLVCNINNVSLLHDWARSQFDLTIYDLPPRLRDVMTFSVLEAADEVILAAEPTDVLMDALQKHLRLCKEVQRFNGLPQKYRLLINKVPENEGLDPEEMAEALGLPLLGVIPADMEHYDRIINRAKFDIPADSPWRTVAANLGIGGGAIQNLPVLKQAKTAEKTSKPKPKERRGLLSFFFG